MTTGERIRAARKAKGFTQKELGESVGVAAITIQQYERNVREPKMDTVMRIAQALGISVLGLFPELYRWHPADQLPRLEERREVDPDEGDYIFSTSAPLLLWCPDKDPHQVVGRYLQEESWVGFADRNGTPMHPTHWMELPGGPEE